MENEEILEEYENEVVYDSPKGIVQEETEGNTEVSETVEQGDLESNETMVTVSDGDSVNYTDKLDDIVNELIYQREQMDSLQAYIEAKDMTIFEKPIDKYTVTEGLLLITLFSVVFAIVAKWIGGIITCKV